MKPLFYFFTLTSLFVSHPLLADYCCDCPDDKYSSEDYADDGSDYSQTMYDESGNMIDTAGNILQNAGSQAGKLISPGAAAGEYTVNKGKEGYDFLMEEHEKWDSSDEDLMYDQEQDIDYWREQHGVPRKNYEEDKRKKEFLIQRQEWQK